MTYVAYPPARPPALGAALISLAAGFLVWVVLSFAGGYTQDGVYSVREAWDTEAYWSFGLAVFALISVICGYLVPRRVWRWPAWMAVGQAAAMALIRPEGTDSGLLPIAILFIGLPLVLLMTVPALIAGTVALRGWSPELIA